MAAGVACDLCREDQLEMECCRGGLLPRSTGLPDLVPDGEEDRISALPDDMLLHILVRLGCARAAAHTGLLVRRWRGLWARLPKLTFHRISPDPLDAALAMVARLAPSLLDIHFFNHHMLEPARVSSLLRAAAALAPAEFVFYVSGGLPVTTWFRGFPALESLHMENCHIDITDMLTRCPLLKKLWVLD
nr:F-box/LRR-repeat protein 25-like [Setaria viridis]